MGGFLYWAKMAGRYDGPRLLDVRARAEDLSGASNDPERPPVRAYVSRSAWALAHGLPEWMAPPFEERQ